jgi:hypothetical protein
MSASDDAGDASARISHDARERSRPPRVRERLVARHELARRHGFADRPISLICAPAGYGKTTIAADWAQRPEVGGCIAWITLHEGHDEPFRFWTAIIEALAIVSESDTAELLRRLRPPQQGSPVMGRFCPASTEQALLEPTRRALMRYRIELDAPVSDTVLAAFPEFNVISNPEEPRLSGWVLVGELTDQSHLHSVIARIQALGLGLAGVRKLSD